MSISGAIESIGPASLDRLGFEYLVTLGEGDPGAAGAHAHYPAARLAIQPTCTIWAHEPAVQPTAIRDALECSGFTRSKAEAHLRHGDPQCEGAARLVVAGGAVACIDELRGFGDLVADFVAQAAAGLWQIHVGFSPQDVLRHSVAETCRIACWRRPRPRPVQ